MTNIKSAIIKKKIEGVIYDLMIMTNSENVVMSDGRSLATVLADYLTVTQVTSQIDARINEIIDGAPAAFDTLKEIADYIATHEDVYEALESVVGDKVDKEEGMGLSAENFTSELKVKLEGLFNYIHPETHGADMIVETEDKQFVTAEEKTKIAESGRIIVSDTVPIDLTENDLFFEVIK